MRGLLTGLLLFLSIYLYGIDYTVGEYNLSIVDGSGHFSLFYNKDKQPTPLFYADNPRSSSLHLLYDERIINLGEDVLVNIIESRQSVIVQYNLDELLVEQEFSFLQDGSDIFAVQSTYRIHNNSGAEISAGIRSVIDTSLGESRPFHFSTSDKLRIAQEYQFIPSADDSYVLSASASDQLAVYFAKDSMPSKVLMANWKRLSESEWDYEIQQDSNFSFRPFSINDSALAIFYKPKIIPNNQSVEYTIVFSYLSASESPLQQEERFQVADKYILRRGEDQYLQLAVTVDEKTPVNTGEYSLAEIQAFAPHIQDLVSLDILIEQIDTLLHSSAALTSRELDVIRNVLAAIQNSSSRY